MSIIDSIEHAVESGVSALTNLFHTNGETMPIAQQGSTPAAAPIVAPVVALPVTGVDPAAAAPVVDNTTPIVETPNVNTSAAAPAAVVGAQDSTTGPVTSGDATTVAAPTDGTVVTPAPAKTRSEVLSEKIAAKKKQLDNLTAEISKLEGQFRSVDLIDSVKAGSVIKARIGRAETSKEVTASVLGVQTLESGDVRYKIFFGEGVDAEVAVIQTTQIVDVVTA